MPQQSVNLLDIEFPIFEEATQTASRFLGAPICVLGVPNGNALILKAAVGLSQLGLMNPLARTRRLPLDDELASYVLRAKRRLILPTVNEEESFAQSFLVQEYGIRSYLGVPLLTTEGNCVGLLAAMSTEPITFSEDAIAFMELLARWSISEYERYDLAQHLATPNIPLNPAPVANSPNPKLLLDSVRLTLMSQLTQEMRNPLTTITGMADMLSREIYGTLTPKQREYAEIVRSSSQALLKMATEILDLGSLGTGLQPLNVASIDFEMLGQHIERTLTPLARANNQEIRLTVEPGSRLWKLDKEVTRQMLHHLTASIIKLSGEGGTIRIHGSEREGCLNIAVWVSHPWLGEGLPNAALAFNQLLDNPDEEEKVLAMLLAQANGQAQQQMPAATEPEIDEDAQDSLLPKSHEILSLLLSRHMVEYHGGQLTLQNNTDGSNRFLIVLPSA